MKGNRFKVYQDPITKQDYEGNAKVVEQLEVRAGDLVHCSVVFDGEVQHHYRWIDKNDEIVN